MLLRQPGKAKNDKNMNKRKPAKAKPVPLQLQPAVPADKYNSKKADPPKKAYQSRPKQEEPLKDRYSHPRTLGAPVEPVAPGQKVKGDTKQVGSQTMYKRPLEGFHDDHPVIYQPRSVPRYSDPDQNIDGEDM